MTELHEKARDWIWGQCVPDSLLGLMEFFDYEISEEDALKVYDLILAAKVEVIWDD